MTRYACVCRCHNTYRGTQKAAQQMGKYMKGFTYAERANHWDALGCARTDDVVAAAIACDQCRHEHCPALLSTKQHRGPRIIRVTRFDPNSDSQQTTQAEGDQGEGPE